MNERSECAARDAVIRAVMAVLAVIGLLALPGCDGDGGSGGSAAYSEVGVTFQLPPGWVHSRNTHYQRGYRDEHFGTMWAEPLEGGSFAEHVDIAAADFADNVVIRERIEINGHEAVEMVLESTMHVYEVYVLRGNEVVYLSFRTFPDAFNDQLNAFRAAARSMRF